MLMDKAVVTLLIRSFRGGQATIAHYLYVLYYYIIANCGKVLQSLIRLKNSLIAQGRYTDAVDDILCKVLSAKKRKFKIKYI